MKAHLNQDVKDGSGPVEVRFVERVDPCSLAEEWRTVIREDGTKRAEVVNEYRFLVGIRFTNNNAFW